KLTLNPFVEPPFLTLFLGVCFFVFLNSLCFFEPSLFKLPLFKLPLFKLPLFFWGASFFKPFFKPFVLNSLSFNSLCFLGGFDEKSFLAFLTIWLVGNLALIKR
ncbi:hypothetical protein F7211_03865, partial [Helicobacter pylori]|nr:hypothetical protein [Helicobacter pylori]